MSAQTAVDTSLAESAAAPPRALGERLPWRVRPWAFPLLAYASTWLLTLGVWAWLGDRNVARVPSAERRRYHGWQLHFVFKDASNYLDVARFGYPAHLPLAPDGSVRANNTAFFPLLPMIVRAVATVLGGRYVVAALLVSVVLGAASAYAVWRLAGHLRGRVVADRAVLLYCVFPGAFVFGFLYSESLAALLAAFCLLALARRRWLLAGVLAGVGTAVRPNMVALCVACAVAAGLAVHRDRDWKSLWAPLLSPLGGAAYLAWGTQRYGDARFWFRTQAEGWDQHTDWGAATVKRVLWLDPALSAEPAQNLVHTVFFVLAAVGVVWLFRTRLPLPATVFALGVLLLSFTASAQGSKPRFVWTAFPLFVAAATRLRGRALFVVLLVFAMGFVWLAAWSPMHYSRGAP
ncbi:glycosyltransferase family 39 protein [Yinghuangia seranimata]|uniref:glycosyltransferase family 39 protein n=1 Tax=Yinghuangia seranimata TaxID=408067 RepID=UPI00248A9907|nr:glycosyltransferase family 39 protein [Yinghuangia seranimata]MDI2127339.1 glycosyltransferase family 39 protein [Yinghuangia seranimata]